MWGPVFCIDFGAGYTKVAVRTDAESSAVLLTPTVRQGGEEPFCVPSVMAVIHGEGNTRTYEYGHAAAGLTRSDPRRPVAENIDIYRNWKKQLFELQSNQPVGLAALFESGEFAGLAGKFQVPLAQIQHLRQLIQAAHTFTGSQVPVSEGFEVRKLRAVAEKFFAFLRRFTLEACAARSPAVPDADKIPVVLAVPSFAAEDELRRLLGVQILLQAMARTGWPVLASRPVVSEPLANMIGVLTGGTNALLRLPANKGKKASVDIDVGKMFGKGPLLTAMNGGAYYPLYRGLVVDVGAYTTDLGLVEVPTGDPDGDALNNWRVTQKSVPLGVMELDRRVANVLPTAQAEHLAGKMSALDWEDFRPRVYTEGKAYRTLEITIPGRGDMAVVKPVIQGFAEEIAKHVAEFCQGLSSADMQEVVITGGGSRIGAVKTAIETASALPGRPVVRVHSSKKVTAIVDAIPRLLGDAVRGGTAMGGVSTYLTRTSPELSLQPASIEVG